MSIPRISFLLAVALSFPNLRAEEKIQREDTEWADLFVPGTQKTDKAHVLLIGDSITGHYHGMVADKLKTEAYVAKLATSKSVGDPALLKEVAYVLSQAKFDVVHFNNGLHGRAYTEEDYRVHFPELIAAIQKGAPGAKLIWATITPTRDSKNFEIFEPFTERVKERNRIASEYVLKAGIPVDDLYSLVVDHPEYVGDGVHFNAKGVEVEASQVAEKIREALK
jgi:hypothetical protein